MDEIYRGETSGRPAVAVAGGEDFEHPAQALRRSEASSAIPVRRPVRAVGAGLCEWFRAEAAAGRGRCPGRRRRRRRELEAGRKKKRREEAAQRRRGPSDGPPELTAVPGVSRGARQASSTESRSQDHGERRARLLPSRSFSPSEPEFERPLGGRLAPPAAAVGLAAERKKREEREAAQRHRGLLTVPRSRPPSPA